MRNTVIDVNGEQVDAYLARPAAGSGPAAIVIQEWWGLVPHIRQVVDRLAGEGFVALAVDHYRGVETTEPDEAQKLMMAVDLPRVAADLAGAAAWLRAQDFVSDAGIGVVGFCMGGGLALLAPTASPEICCAGAFYPAMPWAEYAPDWSAYAGKAALIHKAESDESSAGPAIASYAEQIAAHGGTVQIEDYPGSVHAFFNDARPEVYQEANALAAWSTTVEFLHVHCH
ncbi:MAG: dienelactone hydrolase family protein [Candidatus Nanopelagicales bacterium]